MTPAARASARRLVFVAVFAVLVGATCDPPPAPVNCNPMSLSVAGESMCAVFTPTVVCNGTRADAGADAAVLPGCFYAGSEVRCWGPSVGGGTGLDHPTPIRFAATGSGPAPTVLQVATGPSHACAILVGGTVRCWGTDPNRSNVLLGSSLSQDIAGLRDVRQLAVGAAHTCARLGDGTMRCWGNNSYFQLSPLSATALSAALAGRGPVRLVPGTISVLAAVEAVQPDIADVAEIAAGSVSTCARLVNGTVRCWGERESAITEVAGLRDAEQITLGRNHGCALVRGGTVRCWGQNSNGQLGGSSPTRDVPGLRGVTQISAGDEHTCARLNGGAVRCWGSDSYGQLGGGSATQDLPGPDLQGTLGVFSGGNRSCRIGLTGAIRCWGAGVTPTASARYSEPLRCCPDGARSCPVGCVNLQSDRTNCGACGNACGDGALCVEGRCTCSYSWAACGPNGTCVDTAVSTAHCGACGNACAAGEVCVAGSCSSRENPCNACLSTGCQGELQRCAFTPACKTWMTCVTRCTSDACRAACTTASSVAVDDVNRCRRDRCLAACGDRAPCPSGQTDCGPNEPTPRCVDRQSDALHCGACGTACADRQRCLMGVCVAGPPHTLTIAANDQSTCAVRGAGDDATVVCWGNNRYGRLGYAANGPACTPVQGLRGAVSVAVGLDHACAVMRDRTVRCWGRNDRGQLGDGSTTDSAAPVVALRDVDVLEITAGAAHTCALLRSGALRCWGSNDRGQLGDGTTMNRSAPVTVQTSASSSAELMGVASVRAGGGTTCALKTDGAALCWGANDAGQVGDGTTMNRSAPVAVMGLSDGAELAVGGNAWACARRLTGTLSCWGSILRAVASGLPPQLPTELAAMRDVEQLAAGATHLCARRVGGVVRCYSADAAALIQGVLGDVPDLASDLRSVRGAVSVAAGSNHNCVRFADGAMRCWGANGVYQLGVNGSIVLTTPVAPTCQVN